MTVLHFVKLKKSRFVVVNHKFLWKLHNLNTVIIIKLDVGFVSFYLKFHWFSEQFANSIKFQNQKKHQFEVFNIHLHLFVPHASIRRLIQHFLFAILWMFQLVHMLPMCTICLLNLHHRFVDGPNEHVHGMVCSCKSIEKPNGSENN